MCMYYNVVCKYVHRYNHVRIFQYCMYVRIIIMQVKYFDQKRVYEEYKRKLNKEGYRETK